MTDEHDNGCTVSLLQRLVNDTERQVA